MVRTTVGKREARGLSLHIGLNSVGATHYGGWDGPLAACEFDAKDMAALAGARGIKATVLLTKSATRAKVRRRCARRPRRWSAATSSSSATPATAARCPMCRPMSPTSSTRPGACTTAS